MSAQALGMASVRTRRVFDGVIVDSFYDSANLGDDCRCDDT